MAFAIFAVGWFVGVGTLRIAEIVARWIGPEGWVDDLDVVLGDLLGVILVLFVEAFFKGIVHSINGGFTSFVAVESVDVGFLNEKDD